MFLSIIAVYAHAPLQLAFFGGGSSLSKKALELLQTLLAKHSSPHFAFVVEGWVGIQQMDPSAACTAFGIRYAEYNSAGAAMHHGPCTHGAWFFGDIDGATLKSPVADSCFCGGEGQQFSVRRGVLEGFHLIPPAGDNATVFHDNTAAGDFSGRASLFGLSHSQEHELFVVCQTEP